MSICGSGLQLPAFLLCKQTQCIQLRLHGSRTSSVWVFGAVEAIAAARHFVAGASSIPRFWRLDLYRSASAAFSRFTEFPRRKQGVLSTWVPSHREAPVCCPSALEQGAEALPARSRGCFGWVSEDRQSQTVRLCFEFFSVVFPNVWCCCCGLF